MAHHKLISTNEDLVFSQSIGPYYNFQLDIWDKEGFLFPRRRWERKTWIYCALLSEQFIGALAIVDAGYIATAFSYFYHFETGIFYETKATKPFGFADHFHPSLEGKWFLKEKERQWLISREGIFLKAQCEDRRMQLELSLDISADGINCLAPSPARPFNYTFKSLLLPCKARIKLDQRTYTYQGRQGVLDFSLGYPPRETRWNWACLVGSTAGIPFGANIVQYHNSGLENGLWLGDEILLLSEANFSYQPPIEKNPVFIEAPQSQLRLTFIPRAARKEKIHLLALVSDFIQPFGFFEGSFSWKGKDYSVSGVGVVEEHRAVW
ncbi:MAG: DUF2804 domain-containing protein [Leptospiraceae bacterium]|nr:DUF2804 domain-containing protein [Leptospiraceae bacterium]